MKKKKLFLGLLCMSAFSALALASCAKKPNNQKTTKTEDVIPSKTEEVEPTKTGGIRPTLPTETTQITTPDDITMSSSYFGVNDSIIRVDMLNNKIAEISRIGIGSLEILKPVYVKNRIQGFNYFNYAAMGYGTTPFIFRTMNELDFMEYKLSYSGSDFVIDVFDFDDEEMAKPHNIIINNNGKLTINNVDELEIGNGNFNYKEMSFAYDDNKININNEAYEFNVEISNTKITSYVKSLPGDTKLADMNMEIDLKNKVGHISNKVLNGDHYDDYETEFTIDSFGNTLSGHIKFGDNQTNEFIYEYNKLGLLAIYREYSAVNNCDVTRIERAYDERGNCVSLRVYQNDILQVNEGYQYDNDYNQIEKTIYNENNEIVHSYEYTYDNYKLVGEKSIEYATNPLEGKIEVKHYVSFTYDEKGKTIYEEEYSNSFIEKIICVDETTFTYDEQGRVIKEDHSTYENDKFKNRDEISYSNFDDEDEALKIETNHTTYYDGAYHYTYYKTLVEKNSSGRIERKEAHEYINNEYVLRSVGRVTETDNKDEQITIFVENGIPTEKNYEAYINEDEVLNAYYGFSNDSWTIEDGYDSLFDDEESWHELRYDHYSKTCKFNRVTREYDLDYGLLSLVEEYQVINGKYAPYKKESYSYFGDLTLAEVDYFEADNNGNYKLDHFVYYEYDNLKNIILIETGNHEIGILKREVFEYHTDDILDNILVKHDVFEHDEETNGLVQTKESFVNPYTTSGASISIRLSDDEFHDVPCTYIYNYEYDLETKKATQTERTEAYYFDHLLIVRQFTYDKTNNQNILIERYNESYDEVYGYLKKEARRYNPVLNDPNYRFQNIDEISYDKDGNVILTVNTKYKYTYGDEMVLLSSEAVIEEYYSDQTGPIYTYTEETLDSNNFIVHSNKKYYRVDGENKVLYMEDNNIYNYDDSHLVYLSGSHESTSIYEGEDIVEDIDKLIKDNSSTNKKVYTVMTQDYYELGYCDRYEYDEAKEEFVFVEREYYN